MMSDFIPWNSQPLDGWADTYAQGDFVELDGRKTHYIVRGEGEPVILLHGYFFDTYLWVDNIEPLAKEFKVYALDFWGFGYSTREPLDYGYQLYADQLLLFMDALGIQNASLVGQSMGGGTAILFCTQHRERVNKLMLVDPAAMSQAMPLTGRFFNLPKVGEFLLGLKTNAVRRRNLANIWFYNNDLLTESFFENATRFQKIEGTTEVLTSVLRKDFFYTLDDEVRRLAGMDVPIFIIFGREDKGVSFQSGVKMRNICQGASLEIMNNAGHIPNYENSERFNQLALDFLGS